MDRGFKSLSCISFTVFETSGQPVKNALLQQLHSVISTYGIKVGLLLSNLLHAGKKKISIGRMDICSNLHTFD
jgi:hypothetical protein